MVKWCYGKIGAFISLLVAELELGDIQFQYTMVVQYWSAEFPVSISCDSKTKFYYELQTYLSNFSRKVTNTLSKK